MKNSLIVLVKDVGLRVHAPTQFSGGKNISWGKGGVFTLLTAGKILYKLFCNSLRFLYVFTLYFMAMKSQAVDGNFKITCY